MKPCTIHKDTYIGYEKRCDPATRHERAVRKALKAFEPMVPPHTMTALTQVIEGHLQDVQKCIDAEAQVLIKRTAARVSRELEQQFPE